uniref:Uncharacterized protein n=1 Tax=Ananas comosus var. bracteatus TaxID=296719 RepID=A0A6V7QVQ5_ANACO
MTMWIVEEEKDSKKNIVKIEKAKEERDTYDDDCYEIGPIDFARKLTLKVSAEVVLVSEKEPVALRDFPHPRHLCANFPFNTSPHESYCSQCFCYACEVAAPCKQWEGTYGHCDVSKK